MGDLETQVKVLQDSGALTTAGRILPLPQDLAPTSAVIISSLNEQLIKALQVNSSALCHVGIFEHSTAI